MSMEYISPLGSSNTSANRFTRKSQSFKMSQRRVNERTSSDEVPQQPTASPWNNTPVPMWMGPLAYYNEDMEGQFRTGLSLTGHPGFGNPPLQHQSPSMEDTIFEMNQTGLSPMWRDPSPAYVDPRVGRPVMQARTPLPFQYVTEPPSATTPTNMNPVPWEAPPVDVHMRDLGPAASTARQTALYQSLMGPPNPGEPIGPATPVPVSQGYPAQQYAPYPPYPGPLTLPMAPLPGPTGYDMMQQEQQQVQQQQQQQQPPPAVQQQPTSPTAPILVQLGASQNFLVNNRPARWIQVLDVDPSYQRARTPSPNRSPALSIYVRAPETEVHYWAVFLRDLTVNELIKRVVQKYGFSDDERQRVKMAVRVFEDDGHQRQGGGGGNGGNGNGGRGGGGAGGEGGRGVRRLRDEDVRRLESEVAIDVKVTSLDLQSEDWQLELRY